MENTLITAQSLINQVKLYRILAIIIPMVLLAISGVITKTSINSIKGYQQTLTEMNTKIKTLNEAESFNQFLTSQKVNLEKLNFAVPSESMVVGVVQDIESVIRKYDPQADLKFSSATPAKIGQNLVIPMTISITTPITQIPPLLQELSQLPYILQLISTESRINGDTTSTLITVRLYVQEPFTGY
jgi:hypothetical protein